MKQAERERSGEHNFENLLDFYARKALETGEPELIKIHRRPETMFVTKVVISKIAEGDSSPLTLADMAQYHINVADLGEILEVATMEDPTTGLPAYFFRRKRGTA